MSNESPASPAARSRDRHRTIVLLLVIVAVAVGLVIVLRPRIPPAVLVVRASDGERIQVWAEREGTMPQPIAADRAILSPGPVALRIVCHTTTHAVRSDLVWLTLQSGHQHLVAVGDAPLQASLPRFLAPGLTEITSGTTGLPDAAITFPTVPPDPWLSADDHVLLIINPYAEPMECRVEADGWKHALALPGPVCRIMALGSARHLKVVTRLMPGGEPLEERTLDLGDGLPLYSIGGATMYRWLGSAEGRMPTLPTGALSMLPTPMQVRLPDSKDPGCCLLIGRDHDVNAGLTAMVSDPPVIRGMPGPLIVRAGITTRELAAPAPLTDLPIASATSDGTALIVVAGGRVFDFITGQVLHDADRIEVARAIATPVGLVLLTRGGMLAGIRDHRLVVGAPLMNPTTKLAPVSGNAAAVWTYGTGEEFVIRQPLDGTIGERFDLHSEFERNAVVTAMALTGNDMLIAQGRRIDRWTCDGKEVSNLQPVLILPDGVPDVIGLIDRDAQLVFATRTGVYRLEGDLVVPLVEGIGGPLVAWHDVLLVHDTRTHRLYQLSGPLLSSRPLPNGRAP